MDGLPVQVYFPRYGRIRVSVWDLPAEFNILILVATVVCQSVLSDLSSEDVAIVPGLHAGLRSDVQQSVARASVYHENKNGSQGKNYKFQLINRI